MKKFIKCKNEIRELAGNLKVIHRDSGARKVIELDHDGHVICLQTLDNPGISRLFEIEENVTNALCEFIDAANISLLDLDKLMETL